MPRQRRDRRSLDVVGDTRVHLVREHPGRRLHDRRRGALQIGLRNDAAGRVLRGVEDHEARALAEQCLELGGVEAESALLAERQRHRRRAREAHRRLVDREPRIRVDHLVARTTGCEHREEEKRLRTGGDDDVLGIDRDAARVGKRPGRRLAQDRKPCRLAVVRLAGTNRGDPRLGDMRRRLEVRLADLEVDHVTARCLERACPGEDGERPLGAETADGRRNRRPHCRSPIGSTLHRA